MKIMSKARKLNEPVGLIGQLNLDVIGRLSAEPWCYWLWRLEISLICYDPSIVQFLVKLSVVESFYRS